MAARLLGRVLPKVVRPKNTQIGSTASVYTLKMIGKREIVGHGLNGTEIYHDMVSFPMPAVRFKEPTNESLCLRAKEALPWTKLTLQEKKAIYRQSFCQTFSEMKSGTGEWKIYIGCVYEPLPDSFDEEHQKAQLKRLLAMENGPITGISSKWNYETNTWK